MSTMSGRESLRLRNPAFFESLERLEKRCLCSYLETSRLVPVAQALTSEDFNRPFWSGTVPEKTPARLARYAAAKARSVEMFAFLQQSDQERYYALKSCGNYLLFRNYYELGEMRLVAARTCKHHFLCAFCALRRASRTLKQYLPLILERGKRLTPFLVTHTVKNGFHLGERFEHLARAVSKTMQLGRRSRQGLMKNRAAASCVAGAVSSVEVKRGSGSGLWHPHAHSLWLCDRLPDVSLIRSEWKDVTGDSCNVDVVPLRCGDIPAVLDDASHDLLVGDLCEVFKYPMKFGEMSLEDQYSAALSLAGRRLLRSFGCLYGVREVESLLDEPLTAADEPYVEMMFRYIGGKYRFAEEEKNVDA